MIEQLCEDLLRRVYDSVTAVVCFDGAGALIGVTMFDTLFGTQERLVLPGARCVRIICNHPEGRMTLTREEIRNARFAAAQTEGAAVHVHIYGEDIGLFEVDTEAILNYNGENAV